MHNKIITLDVREDIRSGREPFSKIMKAAAAVASDERLKIIAPFEPVPLFHVMKRQGFDHVAKPNEAGDWEVLFTRNNQPVADVKTQTEPPLSPQPVTHLEIDARGLEPPQPMVKILEALATISTDSELIARTDRRPMHLYAQLEARGYVGQTEEQSDGSFLTHIRAQ
jgi:uncharacterized protein (DUF2249 family)